MNQNENNCLGVSFLFLFENGNICYITAISREFLYTTKWSIHSWSNQNEQCDILASGEHLHNWEFFVVRDFTISFAFACSFCTTNANDLFTLCVCAIQWLTFIIFGLWKTVCCICFRDNVTVISYYSDWIHNGNLILLLKSIQFV